MAVAWKRKYSLTGTICGAICGAFCCEILTRNSECLRGIGMCDVDVSENVHWVCYLTLVATTASAT